MGSKNSNTRIIINLATVSLSSRINYGEVDLFFKVCLLKNQEEKKVTLCESHEHALNSDHRCWRFAPVKPNSHLYTWNCR